MKRFLPFVFPVAALVIVLFLAYRWYGSRIDRPADRDRFGDGLSIEELNQDELGRVLQGTPDLKTTVLKSENSTNGEVADGQIRYEIADGKVKFSVTTTLEELKKGVYQVWLKDTASDATRKVFVLEMGKGGFMGSAAVSEEALPFEVVVSQEEADDDVMEKVLMRGTINK